MSPFHRHISTTIEFCVIKSIGCKNIYVIFQLWPGHGVVLGCGPGYDGCRNVTIPTVGGERGRRETHTVCSAAASDGLQGAAVTTALLVMLIMNK